MMPAVPSIGAVASKWRRRVEGAQDDYKAGVAGKGAKFAAAAAAASGSYKTAISAGDIEARYKSRVGASAAKYTDRATKLGPGRFAEAAPAAEPDFSKGMAPVLAAIAGVDLPPRGPRGSAANYGRVKPIGDALNKLRMAR
jgi:hypothetical protein